MEIIRQKNICPAVINLIGRLDATQVALLTGEVEEIVREGCAKVVIDCSQLDYVASAGLRSFLMVERTLSQAQGKLAFCGLKDLVKEIFETSGFSDILPSAETAEDAKKMLE